MLTRMVTSEPNASKINTGARYAVKPFGFQMDSGFGLPGKQDFSDSLSPLTADTQISGKLLDVR